MTYIFKGKLCGLICADCPEDLSNVTVRLYRTRADQNVTSLAVAAPKDTFRVLSEDEVKAKASSLIAETVTLEDGSFTFELGANSKYEGDAFEIDVYCGNVPHRKPGRKEPEPLQFSITTVQPIWRQTDAAQLAAFSYCIPYRYWCAIRRRFGAWTICGEVTVCGTKDPVAGVKVRAFDTDWLQDDDLGFGFTDSQGKFRIDYLHEDFEKTPFSAGWGINVEWFGGPDLYFRVETGSGAVLLNEPSSRGRAPGRENVGNCFCVELCLDTPPPSNPGAPIPLFTKVGQYHVEPYLVGAMIVNDFTVDGLTTAGHLAFTDTIPLIGILPNGNPANPMEYHFQVAEYNAAGTVLGPVQPVDATKIAPTIIGQLEYWDWDSVASAWHLRAADYYANNPGLGVTTIHRNGFPDINIQLNQPVKAGGWIEVPLQANLSFNGEGLFTSFSALANLDTTTLTLENFDVTAIQAGDSLVPAQKSRPHYFKLFFDARKVGTVPSLSANSLNKIVMSNTLYKQTHHMDWGGFTDTRRCVCLVDIKELLGVGAGCSAIHNHMHALFTAYHPFLGSAEVSIEGPHPPPLPAPVNPPISADGQAVSPAGGQDFDLTGKPDCAYILSLNVTLNLTWGYGAFLGTIEDHLAFCKKP